MPALRLSRSSLLGKPPSRGVALPRSFATTTLRAQNSNPNPQNDAQKDRHKINTDANEYSKSGTDDTAAGNEEAAFDPNITDPQEAKRKAGEGNKVNPLDASPANPEISQGTRESSGNREKGEI
jgi:hypothetical protein